METTGLVLGAVKQLSIYLHFADRLIGSFSHLDALGFPHDSLQFCIRVRVEESSQVCFGSEIHSVPHVKLGVGR